MLIRIEAERPQPRRLQPAIDELKRGHVIIYPTDTGYAFGCAVSSNRGIGVLRRLKGIDEKHEKPLTMLVHDLSEIGRYGHMGNKAFRVVRRLLPGPYTIVLPAMDDVPRSMRNRNREVGLRLPNHAVCTMLVEMLGEPLLTGSVTPAESAFELEDPDEYERIYARDVRVVIDGGPMWPQPSTVLRLENDEIEVLREGQGPLP
jgi:tRNA threonylcarbamoyl adenosine modification protein (Sua5/YciO/YrdC/YwlC family)